ncbi:VOC family protein [Curtobacterium sp. YR515]|uniref:VOC family protein n=1 Tax=Curtobacterium sp. YR515 TaxID=1855316 RepID=UPI0008E1C782|nr:VOC family protein [Curtobacterium sp. YR515]SFF72181.1 Catechol-2,3-dioxygenase [Curtobacterium sp. YR515]
MHIRQVQLATRSLDDTVRFYERLGCAVLADDDSVRVTVGSSQLVFRVLDGMTGAHHLAFTIPTGTFADAKRRVAEVATVLGADGVDEFEGPAGWDSRSVYFEGPDRQLLELIERRELPDGDAAPAAGQAAPADGHAARADGHAAPLAPLLVSVSEVGIAVPDVPGAVEALCQHGLDPYAGLPGPDFAPVGDVDGLLILVSPGRQWFPTLDRAPSSAPVVVDLGLGTTVELAEGVLLR